MNNHPSIHRNAKVFIKTVNCSPQFAYVHYQGIIASADNLGITLDGYSTSPLLAVYKNTMSEETGMVIGFTEGEAYKAHLKDQQQYGIYFLPWSNIAEVVVL
jgi:hypothetical protein